MISSPKRYPRVPLMTKTNMIRVTVCVGCRVKIIIVFQSDSWGEKHCKLKEFIVNLTRPFGMRVWLPLRDTVPESLSNQRGMLGEYSRSRFDFLIVHLLRVIMPVREKKAWSVVLMRESVIYPSRKMQNLSWLILAKNIYAIFTIQWILFFKPKILEGASYAS